MKKHLIIALALMASCVSMNAQKTWFPTKIGTKLTYNNCGPNGKVTDSSQYEIKDVVKEDGKTTINFDIVLMDNKQKPTGVTVPAKVWTAKGYYHADVKSTLGSVLPGNDIKIKGHAPVFPENPKNGEVLENCHASVEALMMELDWTDIKLTTGQTVTTPAGTFNDAVLMEYNSLSKVAIVKVQGSCKEWYVRGIGRVRCETYTKNGKLSSYIELAAIEE